jgi:hypothetical protein
MAMPQPRVYWIRHELGQRVAIDIEPIVEPIAVVLEKLTGVPAESPDMLRLANEIAAAEPGANVMAVLDMLRVRRPADWVPTAHAYAVAPGTVLCATTPPDAQTHKRGYLEAMLLLALEQRPETPELSFRHVRANATAADLAPVLARYELEHAAADLPSKASFRSELTLSIPGSYLEVWPWTPPQRTRRFFKIWSKVAMVLQDALRRWLRYEWLADPHHFADHITTRALVVYWLSPPRAATSRSEFMYDFMDSKTLARLCRAGPRARVEFGAITKQIVAAGMEAEIARRYRGDPRKILAAVRRDGRSLQRLLAMDSYVFDHLIGFALEASRLRAVKLEPESPLPHPLDIVTGFAHGLRSHLRHGPLPDWSHDLATLVLIEATNALRRGFNVRNGIRVELEVTTGDGRRLRYSAEALRHEPTEAEVAEQDQDDEDKSDEKLTEADALPS